MPLAGRLQQDLGFQPSSGDVVKIYNPNTQSLSTNTYNSGTWSGGEPVLALAQGFILITTNLNNVWVQTNAPCYGQ